MTDVTQENKRFVERYLQRLSGMPKPREVVAEFVADPGLAEHIEQVEHAFPEYRLTILQTVAEGDWVVVRATFAGVHRGEFAGIPATGKEVEAGAVIFYRVESQKIVEHHLQFDVTSLLSQLESANPATMTA